MKIFITGGTGFIGSYVIRSLQKAGYMTICASKRPTSRMSLVQDIQDVEWIDCDLFDIMQIEEILSQCDIVIHAAGMVSMSSWKKDQLFQTNIDITANLINLSLTNDIKKFIHFSSVAALGFSSKVIDETAVWTENKSTKYYSLSKYLGEREAWRGFAEGLDVTIINPSFVIGGSYWNEGPMQNFTQIDNGLKYYPAGSYGVVDVRDVADMTLKILQAKDNSGRRFICNGHNSSHKELFSQIAAALGKQPPTRLLDGALGEILWRMAALTGRIRGKESFLTRESFDITSRHYSFDNSQSVDRLGMKYRSLDETISDTVDCYHKTREQGYGILS